MSMLLQVDHLAKDFSARAPGWFGGRVPLPVLKGISFSIRRGQSFGIVGESGSGKTTLTRCIMGLEPITRGRVLYDGVDLAQVPGPRRRDVRSRIQMVFQDPYASLNPRMTVHDIVAEAMEIHHWKFGRDRAQRTHRVQELLQLVGLGPQHVYRHPHEFSGGQRQRIGIARALAAEPELLILDEPTSALDVSVQAQVLNLLVSLQERLGLTYLFISHDLGVIRYVCDRVALIYRGELVEEGPTEQVFDHPSTDYARLLLSAMPDPDPERSPFQPA
jgi:ABC-type glutathione transport system ATPase component